MAEEQVEVTTEAPVEAPAEAPASEGTLLSQGTTQEVTESVVTETTTEEEVVESVIPAEERENSVFNQLVENKNFKNEDGSVDYEKLGKSYEEMEKAFRSKVSAKDVAEYDYELKNPDQVNIEEYEMWKDSALEKGFTAEQFSFVMDQYEEAINEVVSTFQPNAEQAAAQLNEVWGDNFDANLNSAITAFNKYAPDTVSIDDVGNNPALLQILASVGDSLREDTAPAAKNTGSGLTALEVQDLRNRPDFLTNPEIQRQLANYYKS